MISIYVISIAFSIIFLISVIELVRKNKLQERYSILWIFFSITLLILSITPFFIERIALFLDIKYAPSVLFLFGLVYLIVYSLHITTVLSKQTDRVVRLTQEISILKEYINTNSTNCESKKGD